MKLLTSIGFQLRWTHLNTIEANNNVKGNFSEIIIPTYKSPTRAAHCVAVCVCSLNQTAWFRRLFLFREHCTLHLRGNVESMQPISSDTQ